MALHETEWQSEKTLAECMRYMLDNEISTDVCFEVGPPGGETVHIRAHKYMLISRSPVFEAMFSSGMTECRSGPEARVRVEDIEADIFKELLNFMYCEKVSLSPDSAVCLMYAAKKYMLSKLTRECCKCVLKNLSVNNVLHFLEQSFHFGHQELQSDCLKLISRNAKAVFSRQEILLASRNLMEAVLEEETLSVSETLIYKTAVNWAKGQLQSAMPGGNQTDLLIRDTLGDLLYKIRFPAMKPSEFLEISAESNVLTSEEKDSIYYYIATKRGRQLKFPAKRRIGNEDWIDLKVIHVTKQFSTTPSVDAINFTTDQDILLTGIGLYTGYNETRYDVDVEIFQTVSSLFKKRITVERSGFTSSFKVVLDEPILIQAGVLYSVKALSHHNIDDYSKLFEAVSRRGTVTFTFFSHAESISTPEPHGQIPRLYFCYL